MTQPAARRQLAWTAHDPEPRFPIRLRCACHTTTWTGTPLPPWHQIRASDPDRLYDLGRVEVTARYADCSMWKTPCCGVVVDDRGETGWTSRKDYERIDPDRPDVLRVTPWGDVIDGGGW